MTDAQPLVSVIIPSFNHERFLEQAIESVLAQTYGNLELIIVDDGSTDGSAEILRRYQGRRKVTVILHPENQGQSRAVNDALKVARGAYISYLPSDDWYMPDKIRLQVEKFKSCGPEVGVVYGRCMRHFMDSDKSVPWGLTPRRGRVIRNFLLEGNFVPPATPMFRRECFEKVSLDEGYKAEGESIYVKIALHYAFDYVDEIVAVMRDHSYNAGKNIALVYDEISRYWTAFFDDPSVPAEVRALRGRYMGRMHRTKGLQYIGDRRDFARGRRALLAAVRANPRYLLDWRVVAGALLTFLPERLAVRLLAMRPRGTLPE